MSPNRPQDGTTVDIEHLYESPFVSRDTQFPISPDLSTRRSFLEPTDRFDDSVGFWGIDLESSTRSYYVTVRRGRGEVYMGDRGVGFEKDWGL